MSANQNQLETIEKTSTIEEEIRKVRPLVSVPFFTLCVGGNDDKGMNLFVLRPNVWGDLNLEGRPTQHQGFIAKTFIDMLQGCQGHTRGKQRSSASMTHVCGNPGVTRVLTHSLNQLTVAPALESIN